MNTITAFTSRRSFVRSMSFGFGAVAWAALNPRRAVAAGSPLAPKQPHFTPRAKRVLMLCMEGGPSHVDTFDYKPELARRAGKPIGVGRVPGGLLHPSLWEFQRAGQSGAHRSRRARPASGHAGSLGW